MLPQKTADTVIGKAQGVRASALHYFSDEASARFMSETDPRISELREQFSHTPFSRVHDRLQFEAPVSVQILIPEDTFRPHTITGTTLNISLKGMQLVLEELETSLYSKLLVRQRMARVALAQPTSGELLQLTGRIAWIDFRRARGETASGTCCLGIAFSEKEDGVDLSAYSELVEDAKTRLRKIND